MTARTLPPELVALAGDGPCTLTPLAGGCIGEVYRADWASSNAFGETRVVIKVASGPSASLALEGQMLQYLGTHSTLPVPQVFYSSNTLLVMQWLPGDSRFNARAQAHAAELLAALHQVTAPQFGFETDTLIGGLPQPNPWHDNWVDFFREARLMAMAQAAYDEGALPMADFSAITRLCDRLENWVVAPARPALLHGDVWTTNVLAEGGRITGFVDPAVYYGHPEIELAFTTLFGTFDSPFFERYQEISPLQDGFFEIRRDLYNLYPRLVHVRLFGAGYLGGIRSTLKALGV